MSELTPEDPRCPSCGAPVHLNARGCRECGARRGERGWSEPEHLDGIDLPGADDDFDYEDFIRHEFPKSANKLEFLHRMTTRQRFWWLVALITLLAFAWLSFVAVG